MDKHRSIEQKLVGMIFEITLTALILISSVTCVGLMRVQQNTLGAMQTLWKDAANSTKDTLRNDAYSDLSEQARHISELHTEFLSQLERYTAQLAIASSVPLDTDNLAVKVGEKGVSAAIPEGTPQEIYLEEFQGLQGLALTLWNVSLSDSRLTGAFYTSSSGLTLFADQNLALGSPVPLDGRLQPWYKKAEAIFKSGNMVTAWTDVFQDPMGRGNMVACVAPVTENGEFKGAAAVLMLLEQLPKLTEEVRVNGALGEAVVVDAGGLVLQRPVVNSDTLIAQSMAEKDNKASVALINRMAGGETGVDALELGGRSLLLAYRPLGVLPWSVCAVVDQSVSLSPAGGPMDVISSFSIASKEVISRSIVVLLVLLLIVLSVVVLMTVIIGLHMSKRLTQPMLELMNGVKAISQGDLSFRLDIHTGDEIEDFAEAFNLMALRVQDYITTLSAAAVKEERGATELAVARQIQDSILPGDSDSFTDRKDVIVVSWSGPAKEVGGDYYDYFFVDDTHLAVVMADASGKGVPAALFMVIARTLFRDSIKAGITPAQVLMEVNGRLCENNTTGMFVTAFMGILDISTGGLIYANAGHTPPMIYRAGEDFQWLHMHKSLFLAGMEDTVYENEEVFLEPGEMVLLYTDGVTEAKNEAGVFFTKTRLRDYMNRPDVRFMTPAGILEGLSEAISEFRGCADQADDITALMLKYLGREA